MSGYQLAAAGSDVFLDWLEELDSSVTVLMDLGPRLVDMTEVQFKRLSQRGLFYTINRREAELLAKGQDIPAYCEQLAEQNNQPVLYRVDKDGAWLFDAGKEPQKIAPFATQVVDTIGAGDAHAAGLIYGLAMGLSVAEACLIGNAVASDAVAQEGASQGMSKQQLVEKLAS